jgi:hypothetical protein
MNTVTSAGAPALPEPMPRRRFLSGLLTLPLIGGAVTLNGQPTAAAAPLSVDLLESYATWLHFEAKLLKAEMRVSDPGRYRGGFLLTDNAGGDFHRDEYNGWQTEQHASRRAAVVLSAIGCDWRVS